MTDEAPDLEVVEGPVGRATLAAIAAELIPSGRERRRTVGFEEVGPAPFASSGGLHDPGQPRQTGTTAEATPHEPELRRPPPPPPSRAGPDQDPTRLEVDAEAAPEIHEMVTFVVRGDLARLTSERARRGFVREHLLHRLPVASLEGVDRIDVTPWTVKGTVVVRVWCRVAPPG